MKAKDRELIDYQNSITSASAEGTSITTRIRILTKRLATFDPAFSFLLSGYDDADRELDKGLNSASENIQELLVEANNRHAAIEGEDIFKMTNKSTPALLRLKKPRKTQKTFEDFLDDLYYLFYEGSGSGKRLPDPKDEFVVTDIKFLRANTRHDLDHGSKRDSIANRKKKAAIFKKYSGKNSIGECGEDELLIAQSRILEAAESFLRRLP
ncbi:MAG: hypothetical protein AB7V18_18150 [Pyrinomonadaceae bacterium]